ncbi:MAG: hypothetical protein U9N02_07155 [Campylobacterota bacterium]|nr:hypothetical protein [Campylobacterota bacterium]
MINNNKLKQVDDVTKNRDSDFFTQDIEEKLQKKAHQQKLFWSVLLLSLLLISISIYLASTLLHSSPTTQEVAIIGLK